MHGGLNHRVVRDIYQVLASYPAVKKAVLFGSRVLTPI